MPTFIGIDLAWQSDRNHSGGVVLQGDQRTVALCQVGSGFCTLAEVEEFIDSNTSADTVIAVDAPLVINNASGQRPCETEVSRRFGAAHAGAHTANLGLYPDARSVQLARDLACRGFSHCPPQRGPTQGGKWFFEVYPHPAHVVLFRRERIIKYKKGRVASRRDGLAEFRTGLLHHLGAAQPSLAVNGALEALLEQPLETLRGIRLKHYEDQLDALLCAYLAAHFWAWGYERNEMIGSLDQGYIIIPRLDPALPDGPGHLARSAGRNRQPEPVRSGPRG